MVEVRLHARNTNLDDGFRESATEKIAHAGRFFEGTGHADVELSEEQNPRLVDERFRVEVTAPAAGHLIRIEAAAATPDAALDLAVDRLTRQLRRLKERLVQRSRRANDAAPAAPEEPAEESPEIVRVKQFVMKPMTVEEAALQMEMLGHAFFFFLNAETDRQSVLYQRKDGRLGLIEPA